LVTGLRRPRSQVVRCPGCSRDLFVLARSPLPAPRATTWSASGRRRLGQALAAGSSSRVAPPSAGASWAFWRWPLLAAGLTLLLVSVGLVVLFHLAGQRATPTTPSAEADPQSLVQEGDAALARGNLQLAADR